MAQRRSRPNASGRFVLRIERGLHAALRSAAQASGVSLNEYCAMKLSLPIGSMSAVVEAQSALTRAAEVLGPDLLGVVVFGSWARGDAVASSDVDLLIVLDERRALTRSLYRDWDRKSVMWGEHCVEPHFVHLPEPTAIGSVWAEAAIDGIVLFERSLEVSRRLAEVRRQIAAGKLVRRVIHGQPYWAEVA